MLRMHFPLPPALKKRINVILENDYPNSVTYGFLRFGLQWSRRTGGGGGGEKPGPPNSIL